MLRLSYANLSVARPRVKGVALPDNPEQFKDLGPLVRALLGLHDLEQQELAILGGWGKVTVTRWVRGKTVPNGLKRRVLEDGLGLPAHSLEHPTDVLNRLKTAAFERPGEWSKSDPRLLAWRQARGRADTEKHPAERDADRERPKVQRKRPRKARKPKRPKTG